MPGVTVKINDDSGFTSTVTTNSNGYYSEAGLKDDTYLVWPTESGDGFSVNSGNVFATINGASITAKDFTGSQLTTGYSISGTIKDTSGQPMPGVTVKINDDSGFTSTVTTNSNGYYSEAGLKDDTYLVWPTESGDGFSVNSGNVFATINGASITAKDFTGSQLTTGYSISGTIKDTSGQPMPGVAVLINDDSGFSSTVSTNSNGYYSEAGLKNGDTYIVWPTETNYTFTGTSGNVFPTVNGADVTGIDFTANFVAPLYSISGFVLVNGQPLPGVTVKINDNYGFTSTVTTDSSGFYMEGGLKNGTYLVYPTDAGYSITPISGNAFQTVYGGNVINKNFQASPQ